jgi:hypothetical protein
MQDAMQRFYDSKYYWPAVILWTLAALFIGWTAIN